MGAEHAADDVVPLQRYPRTDRRRPPSQVAGPDHRRRLIPLVGDQVGIIEVKEPRGLLGHRREDLRGRGLAGDQRRHPPQRRLLVGQYAPGLLGPGCAAAGLGRHRADNDRHPQEQAEHQYGRPVEVAQRRQEIPVEREDGHDPDWERVQDPGEAGYGQHGQQEEQAK